MDKEKLTSQNPKMVALGAAGFAFLAWRLKVAYDRRNDEPGAKEPQPYPMNETVDGAQVYFYPGYEDKRFTAGIIDPKEGYIEVQGEWSTNESGEPQIEIDEQTTEKDSRRLGILYDRLARMYSDLVERTNS